MPRDSDEVADVLVAQWSNVDVAVVELVLCHPFPLVPDGQRRGRGVGAGAGGAGGAVGARRVYQGRTGRRFIHHVRLGGLVEVVAQQADSAGDGPCELAESGH